MRTNMWKKGLVLVIILLFFGASSIPSIGVENISNTEFLFTDDTSGKLFFQGESYFIMLSNYSDSGEGNHWSVQLRFDSEDGIVESEFDTESLPLIKDQWVEIKVNIDLDTDWMEIYYDGDLLVEKNWTAGVSNDDSGILNIGAVDLYANQASSVYYDDISLEEVGTGTVWSENFDSYEDESSMHGQGGWKGWYNDPTYTAYVTSVESRSSPQSVDINGDSDLVHEYSGYTSGEFVYIAWIFVPNTVPNIPSDPGPEDGATDVSIYADLNWTCSDPDGDNLTYNVFFEAGDSTPDEMVSENQTENSYDPGTLEFNTIYYWQIVAYDVYGALAAGPVWNFTTRTNDPPNTPSNPNPPNGATDIPIYKTLSWTGGDPDGDEVTYDVYFGDYSPPPQVKNNQSGTTYSPGKLDFGTTYYWQIVAWDEYDYSAMGSIWDFTTITNDPPNVPIITGPTSGDMGSEYDYTFITTDPDGNKVYYYIEWGDGNVEEWIGLYDSGEEVTIGHTWLDQGEYTIRAKAKDIYDTESDWSTLDVKIIHPPDAPIIDGPSSVKAGTEYDFTFTATDPDGDAVKYFVDWGDNDTETTEYSDSGEAITLKHAWSKKGDYIIQAKAIDILDAESDVSTYGVTAPRNRAYNFYNNLLNWLYVRFPNLYILIRYILGFQ
jgi:hypothetical protein